MILLSRSAIVLVALLIATLLGSPAPAATSSWRNVINDSFPAGTAVPSHWNIYDGPYGSGERNCAAPSQVFVNSDGNLVLRESYRPTGKCGAGWYTGGMKINSAYRGVDQRITLRSRRTGAVHSHRNIPMLWDDDNNFIAQQVETNFCEGESPVGCTTFLHYGVGTQQVSHKHFVDQNTWHTYQFTIRDHRVRIVVDGTLVWEFQGTVLTVPDAWRRLVLQQECAFSGTRTCPTGTTGREDILIDWIRLDHLVTS